MRKVFKNVYKGILIILISICLINSFTITRVNAYEKPKEKYGDINNDKDIKDFMDNYFNEKMKKYFVPGASVVVVKDNKEVFKSGYGYSNLEDKTLVNPDTTLFPACSVSKLFTATAIIKLYEEGKIDLDKDVNYYISPYKVINNYDEPVTCRNLLTHSSGLDEESELNVSVTNYDEIKSQEYYFNIHPLKVITKPNTICRYSNIGYDLLGFIIEKVSGISYEEFIKQNILNPLNMKCTLIREKNDDTAVGYIFDDNNYVKAPFSYQYTSGSSGIIATAKEMENFIIANLTNNKILSSENMDMMHKKQFSNSKELPGMGFGFIRSYRNNKEIIKHEGGLPGYTTTLLLIPKENLGIYIATNSLNALPFNFEEEFLNYFYPCNNDDFNKTEKIHSKDYSKYEGNYRSYDGVSKTNIMKLASLFDSDIKIKDNKDGTLTLNECTQAKEEITTKLVEIEDGVFLREDKRGNFCFRFDDDGNVTYAFNDVSINSYEKVKFYEKQEFILCILVFTMIMFIVNIIMFLKKKKISKLNLIIESLNIIGGTLTIILTIWMCINADFSLKYLLYLSLTLLNISVILITFSIILFIYALISKRNSIKKKVYYALLNIDNLALIWLLYYFNFLGYKLY